MNLGGRTGWRLPTEAETGALGATCSKGAGQENGYNKGLALCAGHGERAKKDYVKCIATAGCYWGGRTKEASERSTCMAYGVRYCTYTDSTHTSCSASGYHSVLNDTYTGNEANRGGYAGAALSVRCVHEL